MVKKQKQLLLKQVLFNQIQNLLNIIVARIKNGWLDSDCDKGTTRVTGSINHCPAPAATQIDTTTRTTKTLMTASFAKLNTSNQVPTSPPYSRWLKTRYHFCKSSFKRF